MTQRIFLLSPFSMGSALLCPDVQQCRPFQGSLISAACDLRNTLNLTRTHPGDIKGGAALLRMELDCLHKKLNKPIIVTDFGADTYPDMHADWAEMFTEEFQKDLLKPI